MPLAGDRIAHYRLETLLGRGGGGEVWRAQDESLHRAVALKVVNEPPAREARAAARLAHPNIAQVYEAGENYIAMQLIQGRTLEGMRPAPREAATWIRDAALAVQYAHEQGVIHRDLKPANLMLQDGHLFVTDFGLAKITNVASSISSSGAIIGTPAYMAPEQARGEPIDPRADVYALGATLYALLAGRPPFESGTLLDLLRAVAEEAPASTRTDPVLDSIVLRCLEKNRARRYPTARALAEDLDRYLRGEPVSRRPISPRVFAYPAIAIAVAVAIVAWPKKRTEPPKPAPNLLEKADRVSAVLSRWAKLQDVLLELETIHYDSRLTKEERRKAAESAWKRIEQFVAETPPDSASQSTARSLGAWARVLAGYHDEAMDMLRAARPLDPDIPYPWLVAALVMFYPGVEFLRSYKVYRSETGWEQGLPKPAPPEYEEARKYVDGVLAEARRRPVWGKEGAADVAAAFEGMMAMYDHRFAEAARIFTRALESTELRPFETGFHYGRAKAHHLNGDQEQALRDLEIVIRRRPQYAEVHTLAGEIFMGLERYDDAAAAFTRSLDLQPSLEAVHQRGLAWLALDRIDDAIAAFDEAIRLAPSDLHARCSRGFARRRLAETAIEEGRDPVPLLEAARADFEVLVEKAPDLYVGYASRGSLFGTWARVDPARARSAVDDLERARGIKPGDMEILTNLGVAYSLLPEYGKAVEVLTEAIRANPKNAYAFLNRGIAYHNRGAGKIDAGQPAVEDLDLAIADQTEAIRLGMRKAVSNRGLTWRDLGRAHAAEGRDPTPWYEKSLADLDAAVELRPKLANSYVDRGGTWLLMALVEEVKGLDSAKSFANGLADCARALEIQPNHWQALANRGMLQEFSGRIEDAIASYEAALQLRPDPSIEAHLRRAKSRRPR